MDLQYDETSISQILYPEVHLDSPIVISKLCYYLTYARLKHNQVLLDNTIIENIQYRFDHGKNSRTEQDMDSLGSLISQILISYPKAYHIPYPECNLDLFRATDLELVKRLDSLHKIATCCYTKISEKLYKCLSELNLNCGLKNQTILTIKNEIIELPQFFNASRWFQPFLFWFTIKTELRSIIKRDTASANRYRQKPTIIQGQSFHIIFHRDLVTLINKKTQDLYYLTVEMVLMFCDVIEGRLMTDSAMRLDQNYSSITGKVHLLWDTIDSLFPSLGNKTYNIVALLEPLTLAYLQLSDPSPILCGSFLDHCYKEIHEIFTEQGFTDPGDLDDFINILNTIFINKDIHKTAEMFSFFRSFGHPGLEAVNAATKVREYMNQPKVIQYSTMMKAHAIFCGTIINGFRDRHGGTWPPLVLPDHADPIILNLKTSGEALTDSICVEHWKSFCGIRFGCFLPLELDSDLTIYLKDKALAALKSEWDSVYPNDTMKYDPPKGTTSRRLVNVFLEDRNFDPYEMIMYVIRGDYLTDHEFNLSYSLKEKEVKEVGRLFAKMNYKMRACQVIAENLISHGVGRYFKDNGMAKDEHELTKSLFTLSLSSVPKDKAEDHKRVRVDKFNEDQGTNLINGTKSSNKKRPNGRNTGIKSWYDRSFNDNKSSARFEDDHYETVSAFITTDLKKYCLNWRYETISIFAERLNEIYGLPNFFQWLHLRLERSVLYVSDPHCPPFFDSHTDLDNVPNDHLYIKYPMGGIEGFCQKLWTISTIPYLYLSAYQTGVRIASLVQGDNQAMAITKRVPSSWPYLKKKNAAVLVTREFFECLRTNLGWVGHNLKASETIISSNFFIYSKGIFYDGVLLSQSLKSISRCVFWSETIVDETRSACSNIATTLAKAIEKGYHRYIAFAINILKTLEQILISLRFTINDTMTDDVVLPLIENLSMLSTLILLPAPIGGFNYLNMSRLFVRNIGDVVTASLADVKRMIKSGLMDESMIQKIMNQQPGDSTFLDWASDPYSANLPSVQSITKLIKNITARYVLVNSPNPMLTDLFHEDSSEEDSAMAEFLLDRDIIIPRAAHEIIDNTLTGARESIAGMLDTTKGLIRSSMRKGGLKPYLIRRLSLYDYEQFKNGIRLLTNNNFSDLISSEACSVHLARTLRKHMWFKLAKGRVIYGLEVPDILECMKGEVIADYTRCGQCVSGSTHYAWFFVPANCELDKVSRPTNSIRVPYTGSTTEERTDMKLGHIKSPSRPLKAAVRIATIYTWAYGDDQKSWQEAWYIASQRANITLPELQLITPISTSTNLAHRLRDRSTQVKYSGTSLIRVSRYTTISNDQLSFVIDGKKVDTNYIYQQGMLLGLAILEQYYRSMVTTGDSNLVLHLHADSDCCIIPMNDHPYIPSNKSLPHYHPCTTNRLIYDPDPIIEKDSLRIQQQAFRKNLVEFVMWDTRQLYHVLSKSTAQTIVEFMTKMEKDHLNEIKSVTADDDINSLITEALLMDPKLFMIYVGQAIAVNWAFEIHYRRPQGKYEMIELLHTLLSRSSSGMFKVLANMLSHDKVYKRLWEAGLVEPIHGPSIDTQNLTVTIIEMLVNSYCVYLDMWLNDQIDEYPYILCESEEELINERIDNVQARHQAMICDLYCNSPTVPDIRGLTPLEKCAKLLSYIEEQSRLIPSGIHWNTDPLLIDHYPCSLTYLRRGTIKQIRLRVDPGFIDESLRFVTQVQDQICLPTPKYNLLTETVTVAEDWDQVIGNIRTLDKLVPITGVDLCNYEIHCYRRIGLNSTACYKAVEILPYLKGYIDHNLPRLFLGEGSGAMMVVYRHFLGETVNFYNSGVSSDSLRGQREFNPFPSELLLVNHKFGLDEDKNCRVLFNGRPEVTWVGNPECLSFILSNIKPSSIGLIHSDIESDRDKTILESFEELIHVFCIASVVGSIGSSLVIKMMPRTDDYSMVFIKFVREHYLKVFLVYPTFSNLSSTEFYLICRNLKANKMYNPKILTERLTVLGTFSSSSLISHILEKKYYDNVVTTYGSAFMQGYPNSHLSRLCEVEYHLMDAGFDINGIKVVKKLLNHEISAGEEGLKSSIKMLYKELLIRVKEDRIAGTFLQPYPILEESKIREIVRSITHKYYGWVFLYSDDFREIKYCYNNLKKKMLVLDLATNKTLSWLTRFMRSEIRKQNLKTLWQFDVNVQEIKEWYKLTGYAVLIRPV